MDTKTEETIRRIAHIAHRARNVVQEETAKVKAELDGMHELQQMHVSQYLDPGSAAHHVGKAAEAAGRYNAALDSLILLLGDEFDQLATALIDQPGTAPLS